MATKPDQRRVTRFAVPRRWGGGDLDLHVVRLLDISAAGARITHREPLHVGGIGYVDLPLSLGAIRLLGRLVWTRLKVTERTWDGDRRALYESGLEFTSLTPEQEKALAEALATLRPAQDAPDWEPSA